MEENIHMLMTHYSSTWLKKERSNTRHPAFVSPVYKTRFFVLLLVYGGAGCCQPPGCTHPHMPLHIHPMFVATHSTFVTTHSLHTT